MRRRWTMQSGGHFDMQHSTTQPGQHAGMLPSPCVPFLGVWASSGGSCCRDGLPGAMVPPLSPWLEPEPAPPRMLVPLTLGSGRVSDCETWEELAATLNICVRPGC
jgi:hypothetical protein